MCTQASLNINGREGLPPPPAGQACAVPHHKMRTSERGERERAAFALATAYASASSARAATGNGGRATCGRPMSARSTASNRHVAKGGRASAARSRGGWVGEIDERLSLGLDFRRRRAALMSRPRAPTCETSRGGAVHDLEALEDQNHRLKVALSRLIEENKRYRVNKARLEGELLRADAKVEILLSELEQAPGKREVEKCAIVRSLAKQKEHLQKMLSRQERELDAIKQTKEWSAVVEMTAATEEYFLEIRRLQRLLAQQQQDISAQSPKAGVSDREGGTAREEYVPNEHDFTQRRNSGVDDTVWIRRPETHDGSMSIPSPVDGLQDNQNLLDGETTLANGGDEVYSIVHNPAGASAVQTNEFRVARGDSDMLLHEWAVPAIRRRPTCPKRSVSPPGRARMATRAGRETLDTGIPKKISAEPRGSSQTTQVARGVLGHKHRGSSQSQVWIRGAQARASARAADAQRSAVGISRPLSAPRTRREIKLTTGDAWRAGSPLDKARRQRASSDRGAAVGSGGGGSAAFIRQKSTSRSSPSSRAPADNRIPAEPRSWKTGDKRRSKPRSHSASPHSSSRKRAGSIDTSVPQAGGTTQTASVSISKPHRIGKKDDSDGGDNSVDAGSDAGTATVAVALRSSQQVEDDVESPPLREIDSTSDDVYFEDGKLSSSAPLRESLVEALVECSSTTAAKVRGEGTTATTTGQEGLDEHTADCGSKVGPPGDGGHVENAGKDNESTVAEGDEPAYDLHKSDPSWSSSEAVGEPPTIEANKDETTEEGSVRPIPSPDSTDIDARENSNADVEKSATSTSSIRSDDGVEQQAATAGTTDGLPSDASPRSGSNGSPNDGDNKRLSPLSKAGDDTMITQSVSSHAGTENGHEGEEDVDAALEMNKLLSDVDDDPLIGGNGATPSEYGDDFDDDFEDEDD